jgi:hypothetical protein
MTVQKIIKFDNPGNGPEIKDMTIAEVIIAVSSAGADKAALTLDVKRTGGRMERWKFTMRLIK